MIVVEVNHLLIVAIVIAMTPVDMGKRRDNAGDMIVVLKSLVMMINTHKRTDNNNNNQE